MIFSASSKPQETESRTEVDLFAGTSLRKKLRHGNWEHFSGFAENVFFFK